MAREIGISKRQGMKEPSFANHEQFVENLWEEITTNGMYGRSKNDFYDYVLYLLNKYDTEHFLSANDNADNERLLKINATRIKAAKKNISVKFMDNKEYDEIFMNFVAILAEGKLPRLSDDGTRYTMFIEDVTLRSALETRLKRSANTTFDYKLNTELVTVEHEAFVKMLAAEISDDPDVAGLLKSTAKSLKAEKAEHEITNLLENAVKADSVSGGLKLLGIAGIRAVANYVKTNIN